MFEGEIIWISPLYENRKGGLHRQVVLELFDTVKVKGRVFLDPTYRNYARWEPHLEKGTVLKNLVWKNSKNGLIDGDSPVEEV